MSSPLFISFEGIDGCGKSTQIGLLEKWLKGNDIEYISTREPGGCKTSEDIRELVLSTKSDLGTTGELFLYLAARAEHLRQVISPALAEGKIVISDRFSDATFAYQGYGRGVDLNELQDLNRVATSGVKPDITYILDIPLEVSKQRLKRGRNELDRMEKSSTEFFSRVRDGYLEIAKTDSARYIVIDGSDTINNIHERVTEILQSKIQER